MEIKAGMIVKSAAGHDGGSFYAVVRCEGGFAYIADGRRRKLALPKKKNGKHLKATQKSVELAGLTDKKLRSVLHSLNFGEQIIAEESDLACLKKM